MKKDKELDELMKKLKEGLKELKEEISKDIPKPKFEIHLKSYPDGEGYQSHIEGNWSSLMLALAELSYTLVQKTNLSKEDILEAVNRGLDTADENEDEGED